MKLLTFVFFVIPFRRVRSNPGCSGLPGYLPVGDAHIFVSSTSKTYADAKAACRSQEALLAMPKTKEISRHLRQYEFDKWVGLENPNQVDCEGFDDCDGKLYWADGSLLANEVDAVKVVANSGDCMTNKKDGDFFDKRCNRVYRYACQLNCSSLSILYF